MITVTFTCDGSGCSATTERVSRANLVSAWPPPGWARFYGVTGTLLHCPVCWAELNGDPVETIRGGAHAEDGR